MKKAIINLTLAALGMIALGMILDDDPTGQKTAEQTLHTKIGGFTIAAAVGYILYSREAGKYKGDDHREATSR